MIGDLFGHEKRLLAKSNKYKAIFAGDIGQHVLGDILQQCGTDVQSFVPGSPDETAFNEGRRRVGNYIEKMLNMSTTDAKRIADLIKATERSQEGEYGE